MRLSRASELCGYQCGWANSEAFDHNHRCSAVLNDPQAIFGCWKATSEADNTFDIATNVYSRSQVDAAQAGCLVSLSKYFLTAITTNSGYVNRGCSRIDSLLDKWPAVINEFVSMIRVAFLLETSVSAIVDAICPMLQIGIIRYFRRLPNGKSEGMSR